MTAIWPYSLGVYVEHESDFNRMAEMLQNKNLQARYYVEDVNIKDGQTSAIISFEMLSQDELETTLNGIMDEITKLLTQTDMYCLLIKNNDMGDWLERKAFVRNSKVEWQNIPMKDGHLVYYQDYDEDEPFVEEIKPMIVKELFPL